MSMVAVAIAGTVVAGTGAVISANAASNAAEAQGNIAKAQEAMANKAIGYAAPTAAEIDTLGNQISNYTQAHSQAQSQLSTLANQITQSYGANVLELGQQLHDQITGKDSGVVATASQGITKERSKLEQSLIDKLGPGALTSSAGIQALNNFDMQSNSYLASLRQDAVGKIITNIGGLQGSQSTAVASLNGINSNLSGMLNQIQGTQDRFQTRQANAAIGAANFAGSENVEGLQKAKATQQLGSQIAGIGGQMVGAGIGAGMKAGQNTSSGANGSDFTFNGDILNAGSSAIKPATSNTFNAGDISRSVGATDLKFGDMEGMA